MMYLDKKILQSVAPRDASGRRRPRHHRVLSGAEAAEMRAARAARRRDRAERLWRRIAGWAGLARSGLARRRVRTGA
ncbi:hypothetical protein LCL97_09080 [Seohaeicola saemankumensis]|nr:hypothetical protein [Seohaeicola saemankumensis]MCA0870977.1 hypothetical protein [Seohaeicola saemankumensis]